MNLEKEHIKKKKKLSEHFPALTKIIKDKLSEEGNPKSEIEEQHNERNTYQIDETERPTYPIDVYSIVFIAGLVVIILAVLPIVIQLFGYLLADLQQYK